METNPKNIQMMHLADKDFSYYKYVQGIERNIYIMNEQMWNLSEKQKL